MQYLVEGITKDIIAYLMEDSGCDLPTALNYIESSAYVYEMLKGELTNGRLK